jgi:galactoside O-acetyltransferase
MPSLKHARRLAVVAYECLNPAFAAGLIFGWFVKRRLRHCGSGLRLATTTSIRGHRNITIGNDFSSMGHLYLYANDGGLLEIGNACSVNTNVQLGAASGRIKVGNGVMIGPNVVIRAANHGMQRRLPMMRQPWEPGEIIIEDDVWIGANAVITGRVTLALGTVVAAGAVVTHSTEAYSIVGGVPARKIGERV